MIALPIACGITGTSLIDGGSLLPDLTVAGVGLSLGPELLTNGGFDSDTVWVKGVGWVIAAGIATVTLPAAASGLTQSVSIVAGRTYLTAFTLSGYVGGSIRTRLQNSGVVVSNQPAFLENGIYSTLLVANGAGNEFAFFAPNSQASLSIDSASLRLVL